MATEPVWIAGQWRQVDGQAAFQALAPSTGLPIESHFPISSWADCDLALDAAVDAFWELRQLGPDALSDFLLAYADAIDADAEGLVEIAHRETALAKAPRLKDVELPRTTNQLRLAAKAAQTGSWSQPIIDTKLNIRSCLRQYLWRRLRRCDRGRLPGDRQGEYRTSRHDASLRETGRIGDPADGTSLGNDSVDLPHQPRGWRSVGFRSSHRRHRLHRLTPRRTGSKRSG
jgi:hypothetical protein